MASFYYKLKLRGQQRVYHIDAFTALDAREIFRREVESFVVRETANLFTLQTLMSTPEYLQYSRALDTVKQSLRSLLDELPTAELL